jgi:hypothetical protein
MRVVAGFNALVGVLGLLVGVVLDGLDVLLGIAVGTVLFAILMWFATYGPMSNAVVREVADRPPAPPDARPAPLTPLAALGRTALFAVLVPIAFFVPSVAGIAFGNALAVLGMVRRFGSWEGQNGRVLLRQPDRPGRDRRLGRGILDPADFAAGPARA